MSLVRPFAIATFAIVGLLARVDARAQWYSSYPQAPAYPTSPQRPYAVEVAPNAYVIHRPRKSRDGGRRTSKVDIVHIHSKKIVREEPVVVEHERVVDDPPRVIERRHLTEDAGRGLIRKRRHIAEENVIVETGGHRSRQPATSKRDAHRVTDAHTEQGPLGKRVIKADAEVTILGPDRMSIRLFRKKHGGGAEVDAQ